tara:strand:- start:326 stop:532 length:207 start_codon:yes stop_codon:yes gene_type:complete
VERTEVSVQSLEKVAKNCRRSIVDMIHKAGAGHPGGSLSAIDLIVALYGTQLNVDSIIQIQSKETDLL